MLKTLLTVPIFEPEDLLIWADLWEDNGLPDHGKVLRFAHAQRRWPTQHQSGAKSWRIHRNTDDRYFARWKSIIIAKNYRIPHESAATQVRRYSSNTAAFLDLIMNATTHENPKKKGDANGLG